MKTSTLILSLICLACIGYLVIQKPSLPTRLPPLHNYEAEEFLDGTTYLEPTSIEDGLAVYAVGSGSPVLLLPYPHAHTVEPMAQGPIADALVEMGRTVITFDVPGAYQSTREPVGDMDEMLSSAIETLDRMGIDEPIDVVGHSMSGLTALAFAIEHPERTSKLVLIGAMSGFPTVLKHGMPKSVWKMTEIGYWQFIFLGLKVKSGFGTLADHKQLQNIMSQESFYDKSLFTGLSIQPNDKRQGIPIREKVWGGNLFNQLDYSDRLASVNAPTLIIAGKYDPEAPLVCSEELHEGIQASELVVFEFSGHFPFLEEPQAFADVLQIFLNQDPSDPTVDP